MSIKLPRRSDHCRDICGPHCTVLTWLKALGFLSLAGDAKVRLTTPWTSLPAPTSSLLTIASRKCLVAAAGPDQVVVAKTESVRKAFDSPKDGDSDIRAFEPQLVMPMPMPMRISQIAFTADEQFLVLTAETGGGLAVYDVQSLLQGSTSPAFELATNGEPLRSLIPNPTPDKAELCAIVTNSGNLHMANLKDRRISNVLKGQVSCTSWSAKGKQLCAGLADGSIHQMTPEGEAKAEIPKPPGLDNCHGMAEKGSSSKSKANQPASILAHMAGEQSLPRHSHRDQRVAALIRLPHNHPRTPVSLQLPEASRSRRALWLA